MENQSTRNSSVSLYPVDWATAAQVAKDYGLTGVSAGLRFIIRDWLRLKQQPAPAPGGNGGEEEA